MSLRNEVGLLNCRTNDRTALSVAFRPMSRVFAHRRVATGLLFALAALVAMPMPATPHQIGDSDHDPDCTYDYCHSPEFLGSAPTFRIPNNIGESQDIGVQPLATDADHSDPDKSYTMVYTLRDGDAPVADDDEDKPEYADGDAAAFYIYRGANGERRLRTDIPHYETRVYRLKLVACDGNYKRGYIAVTIIVNDATGDPPLAPGAPSVTGASTASLTVHWTASDNAGRAPITSYDLQYRESGTQNWTNGPQDLTDTNAIISGLEQDTEYDVHVRATNEDGDSPWSEPGTGSTHANDNTSPAFDSTPTLSFVENIGDERNGAPIAIGTVTARDADNDPLTYSLEGADASSFTINNEGHISAKQDINFDHEAKPSYSVTVKVEDGKGGSDTVVVEILVTDEDEPPLRPAPPTVTTSPHPHQDTRLSVTWNPPDNPGRPPITGYNVQYRKNGTSDSWNSQQHNGIGTSTTISGLEPDTEYEVQVQAKIGQLEGPWSPSGIGRTAVTDQTNTPPSFSGTSTTRSFQENVGAGHNIGTPVTATDDDGDTLVYSLEGTDASSFTIVGTSGQIQTTSVSYDYETKNIYRVIVKADDEKDGTAAIAVTIHVTDASENGGGTGGGGGGGGGGSRSAEDGDEESPIMIGEPPVFASPSVTRRFPENTPPGRDIGAPVTATDPDGDALFYSLGGPDAAAFDIESHTGQLKTKAGVIYDYETKASYSVTVQANDGNNNTSSIAVSILVIDVDEKPATPDAPTVSAPEGSSTSLLATWTAPDTNGGPPLTDYGVQYRQGTGGDWRHWWHVGIATTTTIARLRPHTDYQVRVRAWNDEGGSDWSPPGNGQTNNTPPALLGPHVRLLPENTPPGQNIGAPVTATDPDGDPLIYSLEGLDAAAFGIESETGQLKTKAGVTYDHEVKASYSVTVRATDPLGAGAAAAVTILITNVAEKPLFPSIPVTRSLPENTPPDRNIGEPVSATDPDGYPLIYTLEGVHAAAFDIQASTGQLRTRLGVAYDYEARSLYSVTVRATDPLNTSATVAVTIHVTDVAEKPATPAAPLVRAPEGSSTSLLVTWSAPDRNGGPPLTDYDVEYRQGASGLWSEWRHNGTVTTATITGLRPHADYQVRVRAWNDEASSDWSPPGSGRTNNTAPAFASLSTTRSFPENTPPGRSIGESVSATDADGDPLAYRLEGPDAASFDLDTETGQLRTKPGIEYDHEARSLYSVTVRATDPLNASAIITVAVHVTDVAEKPATPAAPLVRALEESSTSLRVRWTAPARNGGPPLTDYDVEYRHGARGAWRGRQHDGTSTTTTITGLSTSTDYEVRVRAWNDEALSDWSPPGNGRTNATANGWLARFGRTVAQHLLEGVEHRLTSPRQAGLQGAIAGHGFGDAAPGTGYRLALGDGLGERLLPWGGGHLETARLLMERDAASRMGQTLLMGSTFELTGETARRGAFGVWGRGGYSRFDGREQVVSLDGGVSTGTLGVDYAKGRWLAGLALSHSRGIGSYGRVYSQDDIEASLTGLYPYAGFKITDRFSIWGVGGLGAGALTLTPQADAPIETDIGLGVAAAGARGVLVTAASGFDLALETDAFWVRATSEAAAGRLGNGCGCHPPAARAGEFLCHGLEQRFDADAKTRNWLAPRRRRRGDRSGRGFWRRARLVGSGPRPVRGTPGAQYSRAPGGRTPRLERLGPGTL